MMHVVNCNLHESGCSFYCIVCADHYPYYHAAIEISLYIPDQTSVNTFAVRKIQPYLGRLFDLEWQIE